MISPQESKPNITIVQDSLLAAFLMTQDTLDKKGKIVEKLVSKSKFFSISMHGSKINGSELWSIKDMDRIKKVYKKFCPWRRLYTGRSLLSLILPANLQYEKKNNSCEMVRIYNGVIYEGTFDKSIVGSSHNSLIQIMNKEYGPDMAANFVDNIQFIANNWITHAGFSIGLEDCMLTTKVNKKTGRSTSDEVKEYVEKCYVEAGGIAEATRNPGIREIRVTASLNKATDMGMKISKNAMSPTNNLLSTVGSGSKGDFFNISQLLAIMGQQNIRGKRIKPQISNGRRTLPHYPFGKLPQKEEYESRGFVRNSFIHGLNPQEFYFHAMSGREGICDKQLCRKQVAACMITIIYRVMWGKQCYHLVFCIVLV
jgi:DNA-directed RNA polymerase II subunit RPB1